MVDDHGVAARAPPAGGAHRAAVGGIDGRAVGTGNVDALMTAGGAADTGVAVAEVGGDASRRGPAEAPRCDPARTFLGAAGTLLAHRIGQRHGGDDLALGLQTVDVYHVGYHIAGAVFARGEHAVVTLVHAGIVDVDDVIGNVVHIVLPLRDLHGQIGHGVADDQLVTDLQLVDVVAGVEPRQIVGGHAVVRCDLTPGVAGDDGVDHLAGLGAVERLGNVAEVGDRPGGNVALADAHVLLKISGERIVRGVELLDLLEQVVQRALILGRADQLVADIE